MSDDETPMTKFEEMMARAAVENAQAHNSSLKAKNALMSLGTLVLVMLAPAVVIIAYTFAINYLRAF